MRFKHINDMTPDEWAFVYSLMFDPDMMQHTGTDLRFLDLKPDLWTYYQNVMRNFGAGTYNMWLIKDPQKRNAGYVVLDASVTGEYEVGTILADGLGNWRSGLGVRATLHAMKWVFEDADREWVYATTQGIDPSVRKMLIRGGYRPFGNVGLIMDKRTWKERWEGKV